MQQLQAGRVDAQHLVAGERERLGVVQVRQQHRLELFDVLDAEIGLQRQDGHGGVHGARGGSEGLSACTSAT